MTAEEAFYLFVVLRVPVERAGFFQFLSLADDCRIGFAEKTQNQPMLIAL